VTVPDWLLEADPPIRWQALRDLVQAPGEVLATERARTAGEGLGRILAPRWARTVNGRVARTSRAQ
jgi:hypothetical protein